jgi:hypothetical protein
VKVIEVNYVMQRLLKQRTKHILEMSLLLQKGTSSKSQIAKFQEKLITILVSKFDNVFTAPDGVLMQQDQQPWLDPNGKDQEEEEDEADGVTPDSFMYFVRTG